MLLQKHIDTVTPTKRAQLNQSQDVCLQVPGRIWDGKESVLAALAAVTKACSSAISPADGARVVAALTEAAGRKKSDFRQAGVPVPRT